MKKIYLFIFSLIISLIPIDVYAQKPSEILQYKTKEYVIDAYHIDIVVNEDNTFDITENITMYANIPRHGINRKIPIRNTVKRLDGTVSNNKTELTDLKVNDQYELTKKEGKYNIKIGVPDITFLESKDYEIKYKYNLGEDPIKDADELYFNIIGTEWDTVIGNITFKITMPKEFDESKLGFSSGDLGSIENKNVYYNVYNNVITGGYSEILDENQALTIRMELPEEYFTGETKIINVFQYLAFGIILIFVIISIILWFIYGKDKKTIDVVEYYPPKDINSLEAAFIYKGKIDSKDIVSLIIYLANEGYLKIHEINTDQTLLSSGDFRLEKIKDYDGNDENERQIFNAIFKDNDTEILSSDLPKKLNSVINKILKNSNSKKVQKNIFEKSSLTMSTLLRVLCVITVILTFIVPSLDSGEYQNVFIYSFMIILYLPFYSLALFGKTPLFTRLFVGIFVGIHSFIMFSAFGVFTMFFSELSYMLLLMFSIFSAIVIAYLSKIMPKRNEFGKEMLSKINGFRTFLETVEKEKLEMLVDENPEYFYDILPYIYVLDISDKWIEKFESIIKEDPSWYQGNSSFNVTSFNTFVNTTTKSVQRTVNVSSSGGSGGSSSGGGSSGGGSGGGGGSSW